MKPRDESRTFRNMFTHPHAVLPVIHVESELQALRNAERALTGGADGVFLINHSTSSESLLATHAAAADRFPDFWIGVNCLDLHPAEVFSQISPRHQPDRLCACAHARRFSIRRRAYAAYGGIYIAASLVWLWLVEGQAPTRSDLAVAAAFAGVGVRVDYSTAYDRAA